MGGKQVAAGLIDVDSSFEYLRLGSVPSQWKTIDSTAAVDSEKRHSGQSSNLNFDAVDVRNYADAGQRRFASLQQDGLSYGLVLVQFHKCR